MSNTIYTFSFTPNWMQLTNEISQIDRFDASWSNIEKREGQSLKQLKAIATVRSVGASTRIEGAKLTDDEVEVLIKKISISKLEERDQQEVVGYFETLELIAESFREIEISENNIKHLHNTLLKHNEKDSWHKGDYKQLSNAVEANNPDGTKQLIFKTTEPGFATKDAMANLIEWYHADKQTHSLIKAALFVYEFLSIHPFQDGNGRLSRLLGTLLLLRRGYSWIQYVSFEHEIENRKSEYYRVLMECQRQRPNEEVYQWVMFFLDCLKNIQNQLEKKMEVQTKAGKLPQKEKIIYSFIENHPGSKSGEISEKLGIPLPTIKKILNNMVKSKLLVMTGAGAGTNYNIEGSASINKNLSIRFTNTERKREFTLVNQSSFIQIKDIRLTARFDWSHPDDWARKLGLNGLYLEITCTNREGSITKSPYHFIASMYHREPTIILDQPIDIPGKIWEKLPFKKEYPIIATIELKAVTDNIDFDLLLVYDEA
jgi:Fic family protein